MFFLAIVKLWDMNKGVQYDMSSYMILAMLPRDIPRYYPLRPSALNYKMF